MTTKLVLQRASESDHEIQYKRGLQTFALLFTRWMDINEWSHPVMTALAKAALNGTSWLHSSQIAGLRHARLISPGPRTFISIANLNKAIYRYQTEKKLIPNTTSSNAYAKAFAITEDGLPPETGWWVEVFCGLRVPKDIDVSTEYWTESNVENLSKSFGRYIRQLAREQDIDFIEEMPRILRQSYPARDTDRLEKLGMVLTNRDVWTPDEFAKEMPALVALAAALGGVDSEDDLLGALS